MNDNNKISVGLLIPAISVVAFVATLFNENYLGALFAVSYTHLTLPTILLV